MESLPRPTKTYHSHTYDRIAKHHNFDGQSKTILVTGGASGVGYHISKAFAGAGVSRIAIVSRSLEAQEKVQSEFKESYPSVQVLSYQASITDDARMKQILQELGTVDVLILNAAVAHGRLLPTEVTAEQAREAFAVNAESTFNIANSYLATPMPRHGRKTIINVSAAAAHIPGATRVAYGASKAAAIQLMQNFASQFQGEDVRVFSFHPGAFYTRGVAQNLPKDMMVWEDINLPADFSLWLAGPESVFLHGRFVWAHWDVDELIELKERFENDPSFLTIGLVQ